MLKVSPTLPSRLAFIRLLNRLVIDQMRQNATGPLTCKVVEIGLEIQQKKKVHIQYWSDVPLALVLSIRLIQG
jgi:hypothetical protein